MYKVRVIRFLTDPIHTVNQATKKNPCKGLGFFSILLGLVFLLPFFQMLEIGKILSTWQAFIILLILSPFVGYLLVNFVAWVISGTGLWIGTRGKFQSIRLALGYSSIALCGYLLCKLLLLAAFQEAFFLNFPGKFTLNQAFFYYCVVVFQVFFFMWFIYLLAITLAAVKHTSVKKSCLNLFLALLVLLVIGSILVLPFKVSCPQFFDFPELTYEDSYQGFVDTL